MCSLVPSPPGPAALCPRLCLKLSVLTGRILWGWELPGERCLVGEGEEDPALPRAAAPASWREGDLLRAEHLSLLPLLRPDPCSLEKEETPEAGRQCPGKHLSSLGPKQPSPEALL